ncbi:MAG: Energy-conserving hydrogenase subunit echA [Candidatus Methanoperedens nitroreducens]|uniref:Energy-conserving hydrogenase subunit echA n=1 Tax=Candidatus Methanoperedens nitratireducens TaxID=1392998 RepID=A0A0P7ZAA7_9EURY|nr:hydrogenase 4 subunit B [Candidatus Methanoperedens sp. BLZ2]KPQ41411.1 MAG: Energy-conserving hydrogenase subunit echA [Candidatus Methanoperedens sp. BLZ1]MBZ0176628.1 hydrogenase 4 subunit B [Candidatus Methanoperedens nitroreducens]MCX9080352.1 hydrogenase 4 subunit B [Candidatus Methanoperedens sp.]
MVAFYLIGAISSVILNKKDSICSYFSFFSAAAGALLGVIFSISVIFGETFYLALSQDSYLEFGFFVDKLSAFFILVISISVFAVSIFSTGYVKEYFGKKNIGRLGFLYNIFILSMIFVICANNAIMFLIVWELMSVISFFLVVYEHEKPETRKAGFIYIVMTHIGTGFILLSFMIFAGTSGSFSFETFNSAGLTMTPLLKDLAFIFAFIGFGAKAGIVPLHIWLPYAHPAAPSNVSALMSGVMIKTAIFMMIRISFDFLGASGSWWGYIVLAVGTISAILGILYAVVEPDIKRMLAFSSIENIGIILIGLGASMIFFASQKPIISAIAAIAALYHLLNHSVFKGLLFMGAGSIIYSTHTKNIEELGGIIKKMPLSAILILIGVLSISAMPPFSGFVSEWLTFQSLLLSFNLNNNFAIIMLSISAAFLALTGALAAYCFLKFFGMVFLALPRSEHARHAKEVNIPMLAGMGLFALLSILLGILPVYVLPVLDMIAASFIGTGAFGQSISVGTFWMISIPSSRGISISTPVLLAILLILMLIPAIILLINRRAQPIYETWGCGQPISTARNEYSANAFSKPVQMWFKSLYRPARETEATYSSPYLKESFRFESKIEQVFEQYLYNPIVDFVMIKSRKARLIQTGSIHAYLGYIFGILTILFMFIIAGGS